MAALETGSREILSHGPVRCRSRFIHRRRENHHLFASVQSLHERRLTELSPNAYDAIVVDEFHHAAAPTHERFLTTVVATYADGLSETGEPRHRTLAHALEVFAEDRPRCCGP